ncbi:MAG: hypothetical protein PHR65_08775 [Syntrophomonadaceae bacterium]|nr:hypothetical protein [Syntrophomonadaceae bacterium]MDD3889999.1 hypothetical protein [Syntrophomonadaceae bacterium]
MQKCYITAQKVVQVVNQEVGVFEISQETNVKYQTQNKQQAAFPGFKNSPAESVGKKVVDQDGTQYERQVINAETAIKEQGTGR